MYHEEFRYIQVGRRERQWGLYVTGAGLVADPWRDGKPPWQSIDPNLHPEPYYYKWNDGRRLDKEYVALYHPHSSLEIEFEEAPRQIAPPGNFILLHPGTWHRYRAVREPTWTEYWVTFGGTYADHLAQEGFFRRDNPLMQIGSDVRLVGPYRRMLDQLRSSTSVLPQLLASILTEILGTALALAKHDGGVREDVIRQAQDILHQRVEDIVDMQELAESLGMNYHQFRRAFKDFTGFAPYQYHFQLRIGRAKRLLGETELSVKEIANMLKFEDACYLSKMFKRHVGMSPSSWRDAAQRRPDANKPG